MSEIRHRHRILEAIDQLRRRKARPDVNRICSFMFRRFSVSCGETKSDLQKLIDAEIVIKVDYKGNTSYRNAAKWAMLPNYKNKQELDSGNTSSILSSAVAELIVLEPDYLDIGVPAPELELHLLKKDSRKFTKKNLDSVLKREIECGTLVKLDNGNYFLGEHTTTKSQNSSPTSNTTTIITTTTTPTPTPTKPVQKCNNSSPKPNKIRKITKAPTPSKQDNSAPPLVPVPVDSSNKIEERKEEQKVKMEENGSSSNSNSTNCENGNVGYRVGGRQKRAKVMFDPSDNNLPKGRRKTPNRPSTNSSTKPAHTVVKQISRVSSESHSNHNSSSTNANSNSGNSNTVGGNSNVQQSSSKTNAAQQCNNSAVTSPNTNTSSPSKTFNVPAPSATRPEGVCVICQSYNGFRVKGVPERVISCSDCTTSRDCGSGSLMRGSGKKQRRAISLRRKLEVIERNASGERNVSIVRALNLRESTVRTILKEKEKLKRAAHPSCVDSGKVGSVRGRNGLWQCLQCKACTVCEDTAKTGPLAVCSTCGDGYHFNCHTPQLLSTTPISKWKCYRCHDVKEEKPSSKEEPPEDIKDVVMEEPVPAKKPLCTPVSSTTTSSSSSPTSASVAPTRLVANSPDHGNDTTSCSDRLAPLNCLQDPYEGYPIDESIPDASHWTPQEVFQYFVKFFDADVVKVFKDQEIDGQSLLLMKRADVLSGLCLKLGPALKVYSHVKKLQIRRSHPRLIWS